MAMVKIDDNLKKFLQDTASKDPVVAMAAMNELAKALELPLRQGIQPGDINSDIFEEISVIGNTTAEFPLHYMSPGTEGEYVAYSVPTYGSIPQKLIQGERVNIPLYDIAGAIDWDNKYAKYARWDIVSDAFNNLRNQFVKKENDDGWHTILTAGYDRNIIVADTDAAAGQFTTRLVSLIKTIMRRNGGGNSTSMNRFKLTDLYVSPEAMEDMRSWNVDQVDELTRREIFTAPDGVISRIFSVNLHDIDELGEGQEYELFFESDLGASLPAGDVEIVVGLDQSRNRSFVKPIGEELDIMPDTTLARHRKSGLFGTKSLGFGVLDARAVIIGSL